MTQRVPSAGFPVGRASGTRAHEVAKARRGVLAYLVAVTLLSGAVQAIIIAAEDLNFIPLLMWMPALASVLVRFALKEGFADVSFAFGGRRTWSAIVLAFLLPFVVAFVAYGVAWMIGLAAFAPPEKLPVFGDRPETDAAARFVLLAGVALLQGLVPGLAFAAGEEIGWRGYHPEHLRSFHGRGGSPDLDRRVGPPHGRRAGRGRGACGASEPAAPANAGGCAE